MDDIFEWGEQYSVGNEVIDIQHQRLFEIGKNIINADLGSLYVFVSELHQCADEHFSSEEAYMRSIGYPEIETHIALHKTLLQELTDILTKKVRKHKTPEEIKNFFLCWLLDHVMMQDMKYFYFKQPNGQV